MGHTVEGTKPVALLEVGVQRAPTLLVLHIAIALWSKHDELYSYIFIVLFYRNIVAHLVEYEKGGRVEQ